MLYLHLDTVNFQCPNKQINNQGAQAVSMAFFSFMISELQYETPINKQSSFPVNGIF